MDYLKLFQSYKTLALALAIACFTGNTSATQAQSIVLHERASSSILSQKPSSWTEALVSQSGNSPRVRRQKREDPPNTGDTNRQAGASGRLSCSRGSADNSQITALVPITQEAEPENETGTTRETVWGLTVDEYPTFWFYLPYWLTSTCYAEFVLEDETGTEVYKTTLTDSQDSHGVVSIQLPATEPKLKQGQWYQWKLLFYPGVTKPISVNGWVKRVELEPQISEEGVAFYEQTGIWYDPLTKLAKLRIQDPQDEELQAEWEKLLGAVNLEAIAQEPILDL
ncbi:MAG: DUF928 domain-containing protein [Symploca sp. SIO2E6]|nr:DUF928 domain-containing protein [Symploca sp. SIO2E6]